MTSANSSLVKFAKEQRAITMRRLPLLSLSILMYFLYDVFGTVMAIQRERSVTYDYTMIPFPVRGAQIVSNWMGLRSLSFVICSVGAILLAIQGFAWLYKQQTVDFYESRPEKRSTRFINILVNGFLIYAIPSLTGVLVAVLLAALNGCAAGWLFAEMLVSWVYQTALFLAVYAMSSFASLLAGTVVTAVLMNIFVFGIEELIRLTVYFHRSAYYATYDSLGLDRWVSQNFTAPWYHYFAGILKAGVWSAVDREYGAALAAQGEAAGLPGCLVNLFICAAAFTLSWFIYRARKAESAGRALIWKPVEDVVKCASVPFFALCGALFVYWIFGRRGKGELSVVILTVLLIVFVSCLVLETVFAFNLRKALNRWYHMPILAAAALLILFVYRTDFLGYDRWVPQPEQVESAWLLNDSVYFSGLQGGDSRDYVVDRMRLKNTQDLIRLAEIGQDHCRKERWAEETETYGDRYDYSQRVVIGWRMKNGREVTRVLSIPGYIEPALMDRIIATPEYIDGLYAGVTAEEILQTAEDNDAALTLSCDTVFSNAELRSADAVSEFLARYRQDMLDHYSYSYVSQVPPVGEVDINAEKRNRMSVLSISYPLYDNFTRTSDWLNDNDLWYGGFLQPGDISVIEVSYDTRNWDEEDVETGSVTTRIIDSEQEMRAILDNANPTGYYSAWDSYSIYEDARVDAPGYWSVEAHPKKARITPYSEYGEDENRVVYYRFLFDRVPAFLKDMEG